MHSLKDEEVMLKYKQGAVEAMDELLKRYKNPIYHFALRLTQDAAESQDIAQEVFLKLHQHRDDYEVLGKFSTWLFSIAHNLCISRLRRKKWLCLWPRKDNEDDCLVDFTSPQLSPDEVASNNEMSVLLKKSVQGLPFLQKEALILREYHNLDYQEISSILKKSLGTVKTLIHRARLSLKKKLLPYVEETFGGIDV